MDTTRPNCITITQQIHIIEENGEIRIDRQKMQIKQINTILQKKKIQFQEKTKLIKNKRNADEYDMINPSAAGWFS